jgi:hypothetical protein
MMFPAVPWFGYLALSGLKGLLEKSAPRYSAGAVWTLILLIAIPYGQFYRKQDFGPIRETAGLPEFNQLCQAVRENTGPQDSILYIRARALPLYTGRPRLRRTIVAARRNSGSGPRTFMPDTF